MWVPLGGAATFERRPGWSLTPLFRLVCVRASRSERSATSGCRTTARCSLRSSSKTQEPTRTPSSTTCHRNLWMTFHRRHCCSESAAYGFETKPQTLVCCPLTLCGCCCSTQPSNAGIVLCWNSKRRPLPFHSAVCHTALRSTQLGSARSIRIVFHALRSCWRCCAASV
jgi:hypothetical protein